MTGLKNTDYKVHCESVSKQFLNGISAHRQLFSAKKAVGSKITKELTDKMPM